jgi:hypothetical protein
MSSQTSALEPSAVTSQSRRCRRRAARRAKSWAVPCTRWAASGGPQVPEVVPVWELHSERLGGRRSRRRRERQRRHPGALCLRHANNLESVRTYEGTDAVHTLILVRHLTGVPAFRRPVGG